MARRRYRCSWDDIAWLDANYMAGWGAFDGGRRQTIDFDDDGLPKLAFEMEDDRDAFTVFYQWKQTSKADNGDPIRSRVFLDRRPCRFGGRRAFFICPSCGRRALRLAVFPEGLRCGPCGRVTWKSRREQPLQRLIRRANKIALKLDCDNWMEQPIARPPHMRLDTFERLKSERAPLVAQINQRIGIRLARSCRGDFGAIALLAKLGV